MTEQELAQIALRYVDKGYNSEDMRYGDDLYNATSDEKETAFELYEELVDDGRTSFIKKYNLRG